MPPFYVVLDTEELRYFLFWDHSFCMGRGHFFSPIIPFDSFEKTYMDVPGCWCLLWEETKIVFFVRDLLGLQPHHRWQEQKCMWEGELILKQEARAQNGVGLARWTSRSGKNSSPSSSTRAHALDQLIFHSPHPPITFHLKASTTTLRTRSQKHEPLRDCSFQTMVSGELKIKILYEDKLSFIWRCVIIVSSWINKLLSFLAVHMLISRQLWWVLQPSKMLICSKSVFFPFYIGEQMFFWVGLFKKNFSLQAATHSHRIRW